MSHPLLPFGGNKIKKEANNKRAKITSKAIYLTHSNLQFAGFCWCWLFQFQSILTTLELLDQKKKTRVCMWKSTWAFLTKEKSYSTLAAYKRNSNKKIINFERNWQPINSCRHSSLLAEAAINKNLFSQSFEVIWI